MSEDPPVLAENHLLLVVLVGEHPPVLLHLAEDQLLVAESAANTSK